MKRNKLKEMVSSVLASDITQLDSDDADFISMGGDSISAVRLVSLLKENLQADITLQDLYQHSVKGLAHKILGNAVENKSINWQAETNVDLPVPDKGPNGGHILITGVTGFLGVYLLKTLLEVPCYSGRQVYCHVRATSQQAGKERIINTLKEANLFTEIEDQVASRVSVVRYNLVDIQN
jgi:aryl carrier-like protein